MIVGAVMAGSGKSASAEDTDPTAKNERCATRVSIAFTGKEASAAVLANPQGSIDTLLTDAAFIERFSRFINGDFNETPGATSAEDSSYHMMKYVLEQKLPYKDMFLGQYRVAGDAQGNNVTVTADPNGLGYFRSQPWQLRYAGNELEGYKLVTAYRIMWNTVGLNLVASTNVPGADISTAARTSNPGCTGCHGPADKNAAAPWFALDRAAKVLTCRPSSTRRTSASTRAASRSSSSTGAPRTCASRRCSTPASPSSSPKERSKRRSPASRRIPDFASENGGHHESIDVPFRNSGVRGPRGLFGRLRRAHGRARPERPEQPQ